MPRSPNFLGLQTFFQAIKHFDPKQVSLVAQKKARRIASVALIVFKLKTDMKYLARESRTKEIRARGPARERSLER